MTDQRIQLVNDVTGETQVEFGGQTYTLCFDTQAVLALEKLRGDRPVIDLVVAPTLSGTDCIRMLAAGSGGARRRLRGGGGMIDQAVAMAMMEDFGPIALTQPLQTSLSHATCLHLYDDSQSGDRADKDAADPLAGLPG